MALGLLPSVLKSGHLAELFILCLWQISALLPLHSAGQKRGQRAAVGSQQDLNSLCWRWGEDADWMHLLETLVISHQAHSPSCAFSQASLRLLLHVSIPPPTLLVYSFSFFKEMVKDIFPTEGNHVSHSVSQGFPRPLLLVCGASTQQGLRHIRVGISPCGFSS